MGWFSSFFSPVVQAVQDVGGGIADLGQGAINAVSDVGSQFDDAVNQIPGGYVTLAALAGGVPALGAEGALSEAALSDIAAQQAAGAAMSGAGAAEAAGAGGLADLLGSTDALDYMNLGSGAGGDYGISSAGALSDIGLDPSAYAGLGSGAGGDYGIATPGIIGLGSTDPADYIGLGSGAGGDYGIGAAGASSGFSKFLQGAKGLLGKDIGLGGLTGGGALLGAAGLYKLIDMMKEDNKRFGTPGRQDYTGGALSKFKYDPSSFTPTRVDPSRFRPGAGIKTLAAGGQSTRPQLTAKAKLAAMDPYNRAIAELNNAAYNARMPVGMKAPAGAVSQMGQFQLAAGGVSHLGDYSDGGRLLKGPGDGVSDSIPATIGNKQPARLADGEFVVPARIVSELGNGSTDAGARQLYAMMDRIQKARGKTTGKGKVAKNTRADKYLPA